MIYSHISKLLAPVIASIPLRPLKFLLTGMLAESRLDNVLLFTHGGFPATSIRSLTFTIVFSTIVVLKIHQQSVHLHQKNILAFHFLFHTVVLS